MFLNQADFFLALSDTRRIDADPTATLTKSMKKKKRNPSLSEDKLAVNTINKLELYGNQPTGYI